MDSLRNALQPITHNLPAPIRDIGISLIGSECYKTLILNVDFTSSPECVKLGISKGLGIGIICASSIVKIPQLLKLLNSRSSEGISFLSYLLETSAFIITLAYNVRQGFPFSTYGETALIAVQNVAIATLVLQFSGKGAGAAVFIAGLGAAVYALFNEQLVDAKMLSLLQAGAGVLGVASKAPQIYANWSQGGTGQLSAFAVFNYLAGSLSRIFTTLQEVDDPLILYGFIAGFALNAVLAAQMLYYWNSPASKSTSSTKVKSGSSRKQPIAMGSSTGAAPKQKSPSTRRRA
ncbi:mannose-P-dolichol utilization defect 1 protein [Rhizodiscina lignyota]|uniref:Mannose-P-dolichol utilization defect 1 protein homolog n=1 Tax=Rhizodiscina lignyota TaxID=1504668 RepID=A0A9P4IRM4_9PEZI|nr:mannose-P-dolichol utilization defect 1 protein [Rhizodiscina lignyota]